MSRLSNVSTLKIGIFRSWNTYWFDQTYYANILFNDLKIKDYLSGIFYKLKIISNYFFIYRLLNNNVIVTTNLVLFSNMRFKTLNLRSVHKINPYIGFFYRKRYWFSFLRFLKMFNNFNNGYVCSLRENMFNFYSSKKGIYYLLSVLLQFKKHSFLSLISYSNSFNFFSSSNSLVPHYYSKFYYSMHNNSVVPIVLNSTMYNMLNDVNDLDSIHVPEGNEPNLFSDWYFYSMFKNFFISLFFVSKFFYYYSYVYLTNTSRILDLVKLPLIQNCTYITSSQNSEVSMYNVYNLSLPRTFLKRNIARSLFNTLRYQIESTISIYEQQKIYFNFSINFKQNPYIVSAKVITDILVHLLQSGQKIVKSFFFIRNWQSDCYVTRRTLEHLYNSKYSYCLKHTGIDISYLFHYATKQSPLIGIRIECSGTFKKGKMSKVYFYNSWVKDDTLTGRMPNTSMIADIDYYQYVAISKSGSIGIKTWIFLETHIYNNNHKYISLIY